MPLDYETCECGHSHLKCPECGSTKVTPRDNPGVPSPNDIVDTYDVGERTYTHICWSCGWKEEVTVTIERETV